MDRCILHCDCNSFYASVECVYRPELRGVPMAVCGDPADRHGIVLAKNEPAKKFGIVTAETVWQAKKKCPELVLVPPHFERYDEFYRKINAMYCEYTDRVEPFSIDESWLDVTGSRRLFGDGKTIADTLRRRVREELGITISVGVSFNKTLAKLGSDYKKPDATTVLSRETYQALLYPLPVSRFLFVGKSAEATLNKMGIRTIGELAAADRACLVAALGKAGGQFYDGANGIDPSPVRLFGDRPAAKSVGNGMTFRGDLDTEEELHRGLLYLVEPVAARLRRAGQRCSVIQLTIKYPSLKTITRQRTIARATDLVSELYKEAAALLRECWQEGTPVRSLTVTACRLEKEEEGEQLCLFDAEGEHDRERMGKLESVVDTLRERYGKDSVKRCAVLGGAPDTKDSEKK